MQQKRMGSPALSATGWGKQSCGEVLGLSSANICLLHLSYCTVTLFVLLAPRQIKGNFDEAGRGVLMGI